MISFRNTTFLSITFLIASFNLAKAKAGFFLPDSVTEFTLKYRTVDNLIILPVQINDSIQVNLILDTGCRNIILFGKRFQSLFDYKNGRTIQFSGMGSGRAVQGTLSLNNAISIGAVFGLALPIIVVPEKNVMNKYTQVHGLIGYDIFTRFEIEINPAEKLITFRSPITSYIPEGYTKIPMVIADSRPIIQSSISLENEVAVHDLLIDTGSSLELLLKSTEKKKFKNLDNEHPLGIGLNGFIEGFATTADNLIMGDLELKNLSTGIIYSPWHNYASIGMGVLKNYSIIINYSQSYTCLKRLTANS